MKTAMTIAGVDPGGGAGIAADLKTFAALGVHGTCIITSVTAQNTTGVFNSFDMPVDFIKEQFNAVVEDMKIDCVKTGMLSSYEITRTVAELIKREKLPLVIDPVMAAHAGGDLLKNEAIEVLIDDLLPAAMVITPNVPEAQRLSGIKIKSINDARKAAMRISEMGAKAVLIKGGHLKGTDVLYSNGEFTEIIGHLVKGGTHGSGCTHSAAIAAQISKGATLLEAARFAKEFVELAISVSSKVGKGEASVNQTAHLLSDARKFRVIINIEQALDLIKKCPGFSNLIPEVGCNIAMGVPDASSISDVAAVSGRIVRLNNAPHAVGCVAFGASSHIARIVLTAMHYNDLIRAAMNIRYSNEAIGACEDLGLRTGSFSREEEPAGVSTMEWGVSESIKKEGSVPDVIYDKGGIGKEAMIRLLGKDALEVAGKAIKIASYL